MSRDAIGFVFDAFIVAVVMFIVPIIWQSYELDAITQKNIETITQEFAESVSSKGYIDKQSYHAFVRKLNANGGTYDIEIVHTQEILEPEYIGTVFTGNVMRYSSETYTTSILEELENYGAYLMEIGDEIKVSVSPTSKSLGQTFMKMFVKNTNSRFATVSRSVSGCEKETYEMYYR